MSSIIKRVLPLLAVLGLVMVGATAFAPKSAEANHTAVRVTDATIQASALATGNPVNICHNGNYISISANAYTNHFLATGAPRLDVPGHANDFLVSYVTATGTVTVNPIVATSGANECDLAHSSVTINKVCVGTTAGNFSFTVGGVTRVLTCTGATNTTTFMNVNPGALTLTEVAGAETNLAGFTTATSCLAAGSTTPVTSATGSINLTVVGGVNVVCTVTNTRLGTVNVTKVCLPNVAGTFSVALGPVTATNPARSLTCTGTTNTTQYTNVALGTINLVESNPGAGVQTVILCGTTPTSATTAAVTVVAGGTVNCFVINVQPNVLLVPTFVRIDDRIFQLRLVDNVINVVEVDVDVDNDNVNLIDIDNENDVDIHISNDNDNDNSNNNTNVSNSESRSNAQAVNHNDQTVHVIVTAPAGHDVVVSGAGQQQQQQQQTAVQGAVITAPRTGSAGLVGEDSNGGSMPLFAVATIVAGGLVLVGGRRVWSSLS